MLKPAKRIPPSPFSLMIPLTVSFGVSLAVFIRTFQQLFYSPKTQQLYNYVAAAYTGQQPLKYPSYIFQENNRYNYAQQEQSKLSGAYRLYLPLEPYKIFVDQRRAEY